MKITINRQNKAFHFRAKNESNLNLDIDASFEIGGENNGFRPMELLLSGIATCSTIDLLLILKKQKQIVEDITIEAIAERTTEDSKKFKSIQLHYLVYGEISPVKMEQALALSITKYCSAIQSLDPAIRIKSSYKIIKNEL
jgi:uncharacterized OsmC-like protein